MRAVLALGALLLGLGFTAARADDAAAAEAKKLQGEWKAVALEANGRKAPEEAIKSWRWKVNGSDIQISADDEKPVKVKFKLGAAQTPKEIDLTAVDGPQKDQTMLGIYKLEGERLTICLRGQQDQDKTRPKEFAAGEGSGVGMITLERIKK